MKRIAWFLAGLILSAGSAAAQGPTPLYYWVQAGAGGEWQLRTVYESGTSCPPGATVRSTPSADFPVLVCQQTLGSAPVQLPGIARPVSVPSQVQKVVVIGDTGCRAQEQDCSDPNSWPFGKVAGRAAGVDGDLSVHVGDYIYREKCSSQVPQPCGDNWRTWVADWFRPVGELLATAPWVFARGNHEDCTRGGRGWFVFFDPRPLPADGCDPTTEPYAVQVAGIGTLLVFDSACAPWYSTGCWSTGGSNPVNDSSRAIPAYAGQVRKMAELAQGAGPAWLVTHVPVWARDFPGQADSVGSYILQSALQRGLGGEALPAQVALSLVGHIHVWEAIDMAGRAPVMVLGDGGTSESAGLPTPAIGSMMDGAAVEAFTTSLAFGYTVLQSTGTGWNVTLVAVSGPGEGVTCTFTNGQPLAC